MTPHPVTIEITSQQEGGVPIVDGLRRLRPVLGEQVEIGDLDVAMSLIREGFAKQVMAPPPEPVVLERLIEEDDKKKGRSKKAAPKKATVVLKWADLPISKDAKALLAADKNASNADPATFSLEDLVKAVGSERIAQNIHAAVQAALAGGADEATEDAKKPS